MDPPGVGNIGSAYRSRSHDQDVPRTRAAPVAGIEDDGACTRWILASSGWASPISVIPLVEGTEGQIDRSLWEGMRWTPSAWRHQGGSNPAYLANLLKPELAVP